MTDQAKRIEALEQALREIIAHDPPETDYIIHKQMRAMARMALHDEALSRGQTRAELIKEGYQPATEAELDEVIDALLVDAGDRTGDKPADQFFHELAAKADQVDRPREAKQVIVIRKDLNMRKGKMVAQGAHASMKTLMQKLKALQSGEAEELLLSAAERAWYYGRFKKICVSVESEIDLMNLEIAAQAAGLTVHMVEDCGLTEFKGVPTRTCLAIGPNWADEIDPLTGHLKLL